MPQAGLCPSQALTAETAAPADTFGLHDRGRISEARRADLVLVESDPTTGLAVAARIRHVWKAGHQPTGKPWPIPCAGSCPPVSCVPPRSGAGLRTVRVSRARAAR